MSAESEAFLIGAVSGEYGLKWHQTHLFWAGFACGGLLGLFAMCALGVALQLTLQG